MLRKLNFGENSKTYSASNASACQKVVIERRREEIENIWDHISERKETKEDRNTHIKYRNAIIFKREGKKKKALWKIEKKMFVFFTLAVFFFIQSREISGRQQKVTWDGKKGKTGG